MSFHELLSALVAEAPDSVGALFLDDSGETVDMVAEGLSNSEVKVLGAYLSIALRGMRLLFGERSLGATRAVEVEHRTLRILVRLLPEGYYLVLLQERPALSGVARRALRRAAKRLAGEITP